MRGKADVSLRLSAAEGITPAHAGKSPLMTGHFFIHVDHPRACGEK